MNLYISTYLASYRLDLCERLSRDHGFAIYHYMGDEVPADVKPFWEEYTFENNRLPVKTLFGKYYAVGEVVNNVPAGANITAVYGNKSINFS